jgi:hypothetical protein
LEFLTLFHTAFLTICAVFYLDILPCRGENDINKNTIVPFGGCEAPAVIGHLAGGELMVKPTFQWSVLVYIRDKKFYPAGKYYAAAKRPS